MLENFRTFMSRTAEPVQTASQAEPTAAAGPANSPASVAGQTMSQCRIQSTTSSEHDACNDPDDLDDISTQDLTAAMSVMRKDLLTRARDNALGAGYAGREVAIRISAIERLAQVAEKETFVSSGLLSLDKTIHETVPFASEEDREKMGRIREIEQTRHERDMAELREDMKEQGFTLHEVASLKNPSWLQTHSLSQDGQMKSIFSRGEVLSMSIDRNATARTSATLKEAIEGNLSDQKPASDYLVIATPLDRGVSREKFESGLSRSAADIIHRDDLFPGASKANNLRNDGLTAISVANPTTAPNALREWAEKQRSLQVRQDSQK